MIDPTANYWVDREPCDWCPHPQDDHAVTVEGTDTLLGHEIPVKGRVICPVEACGCDVPWDLEYRFD